MLGACTFEGSEERSGTTKYDEIIRIRDNEQHRTDLVTHATWPGLLSFTKQQHCYVQQFSFADTSHDLI